MFPCKSSYKMSISNVVGIPRNLVASLDFVSAPFRHGYFSMSNPAWIKNYVQMPKLLVSEKAVLDDLSYWYPKVKCGGFISGHDCNPDPNKGYSVRLFAKINHLPHNINYCISLGDLEP